MQKLIGSERLRLVSVCSLNERTGRMEEVVLEPLDIYGRSAPVRCDGNIAFISELLCKMT